MVYVDPQEFAECLAQAIRCHDSIWSQGRGPAYELARRVLPTSVRRELLETIASTIVGERFRAAGSAAAPELSLHAIRKTVAGGGGLAIHEFRRQGTEGASRVLTWRLALWERRPTSRVVTAIHSSLKWPSPQSAANAALLREAFGAIARPSTVLWQRESAAGPLLGRLADRLGRPSIQLLTHVRSNSLSDWLDSLPRQIAQPVQGMARVFLSPEFSRVPADTTRRRRGLLDWLIVQLADDVILGTVNHRSATEQTLRDLLAFRGSSSPDLWIAPEVLPSGVWESVSQMTRLSRSTRIKRLSLPNSIPFQLPNNRDKTKPLPATIPRTRPGKAGARAVPSDRQPGAVDSGRESGTEWLVHWTRGQPERWPEQSDAQFRTEQIWAGAWADRSAFASLQRIVLSRRLIASPKLIRGRFHAVSFTTAELETLVHRRIYRRHLRRWDYEPYGIRILKSALKRVGARPVEYGSESDWQKLEDRQKQWFQMRFSISTNGKVVDWAQEHEWRVIGDLELSLLNHRDVEVFVPTEEQGAIIRQISPWKVVALDHT